MVIASDEIVAFQPVPDKSNKQRHPHESKEDVELTSHGKVTVFVLPEQQADVNGTDCGVNSETCASNIRKEGKRSASKQISDTNSGSKERAKQCSADADSSSKSMRQSDLKAVMDKSDSLTKVANSQESTYLTMLAILALISDSAGTNGSAGGNVELTSKRMQRDQATKQKPPKIFKIPVSAPMKRRTGGKNARA